jgi:hypothetical protein
MRQRLTPKDLEVTEAERRAARVAGEGGEGARNIGSSIGSVAGGALGALTGLIPGVGLAIAPAATSLGAGLGGAIGGEIGGATAQGDVDDANRVLTEAERKRQEKIALYQLRQDALEALMNED